MIDIIEFLAGAIVVFAVLNDVFQSVVVPRPTVGGFRLTRFVIRGSWRAWRTFGLRKSSSEGRERVLGTFAPRILIGLLLVWILSLIIGFGLMLYALRTQTRPPLESLPVAMYFAGTSLLTIGYGDIVAHTWLARLVSITAAVAGLGLIALAISFIFSLYASFQRREVLVVTLDARAGAPPSGVSLLEASSKLGLKDDLSRIFIEWEKWAAEVLDSHMAYPLLAYFRSSHDNESWISALGAVLDAATLVLTTVVDVPRGPAQMMYAMGRHTVEDLARFFAITRDHQPGVERYEFDEARQRLAKFGYTLAPPDDSWAAFAKLRSEYAGALNDMAKWFAAPPTQWIGDRSYRHFTQNRHEDISAGAA
ncbi:MAG TPA: ion channel [Candidatus Dormibacteraeota bacterium]|nr:ion channel [Candidatus Dormibacteraeota bacterium]